MARQPRCAADGLLHLVELRWCADVAARMSDSELALQRHWLGEALSTCHVALHAYALMPARTLLLLTPESADGLSRLAQAMGRRLAAEMRRRHGHRGPVMSGRFRSTILQPESCLLDAMQFVELMPARDGAAEAAGIWSSAEVHRGGAQDAIVSDHSVYWSTGNTPFEREMLHRARLAEGLRDDLVRRFEGALSGGWPVGDEGFLTALAQQLQRRVVPRAPGRPPKRPADESVPN